MHQMNIFAFVLLALLPCVAFSELDQQCLNICFATCHNCNYCQYQCDKDLTRAVIHYSDENTFCELTCDAVREGRLY